MTVCLKHDHALYGCKCFDMNVSVQTSIFSELNISHDEDYLKLLEVNKKLWVIEDKIRDKERDKQFDEEFIELARSVYHTNDVRAKIKKEINLKYGSGFVEEKSYNEY